MAAPELLIDIEAAVAAHTQNASQATVDGAADAAPSTNYRWVKTLGESGAVDGLVEALQNPDGRFMWGIRDIDMLMRGVGPGELCLLTGMAHSGKTQLLMQAICNQPRGRFILFTLDEVTELVLLKLAAVMRGLDPEQVEKRVAEGDTEMIATLRDVASNDFPNLVVIDDSVDYDDMRRALMECEEFWGGPAHGVFMDYVELIGGNGDHDGVVWKLQEAKRFAKDTKRPCVFIHQGKRGDGSRGQAHGMSGMRYGGENEATFVVEVFRRSQDEKMDAFEREAHENTVTINVCKNKRPPSKTGIMDLFMHPFSGAIRPLSEGEGVHPQDRPMVDKNGPLVDRKTYVSDPIGPPSQAPTPPQELF